MPEKTAPETKFVLEISEVDVGYWVTVHLTDANTRQIISSQRFACETKELPISHLMKLLKCED